MAETHIPNLKPMIKMIVSLGLIYKLLWKSASPMGYVTDYLDVILYSMIELVNSSFRDT